MSIWWTIGAFILVLTPIILIHELGHFVAARLSGIKVEEFGLGFPGGPQKIGQLLLSIGSRLADLFVLQGKTTQP